MKTSVVNSLPSRLTKIDQLTRADHSYLHELDECLFLGDYSARKGFSHSATNNLIANFKKPVKYRGTADWQYKDQAIREVAKAFSSNIGNAFSSITLVPVPPSKIRSDPEYDDRLMIMLRALQPPSGTSTDIRELVIQTHSMNAAHDSTSRPPPSDWEAVYEIDEAPNTPVPTWIGIVDDLLVTGCRFRAISNVLRQRFPDVRLTGLFIARRVPEAMDLSVLFGDTDI